jgi:hypothetical protein
MAMLVLEMNEQPFTFGNAFEIFKEIADTKKERKNEINEYRYEQKSDGVYVLNDQMN